jgi:mitochondrial import receptor subunit TOM20
MAFANFVKESKKTWPLLVARFAARQIATEIGKLTQQTSPEQAAYLAIPDFLIKGSPAEYALGDHFERLRYVDIEFPEDESKVVQAVFNNSLPGLDEFLTNERYGIMHSKVAYNAIGVAFSGGREDRVRRFILCQVLN